LALRRLEAAGVALPGVVITAEDVAHGKPAPDCFLAAAERLGVAIGDCLVWEDSPAGLAAADAAGKPTVARTTITVSPAAIGFAAVAKNKLDIVTVPAGYTVQVGARLGDPILGGAAAYK
ncbi:HAD-IA family hydrolase, partial [Klebsiella michiganensis]|uniref:HAD-IA family hydrolase n=1 Tax=Klebsiella michiganensis TaxID=1134687 RepID=UPI0013D86B5B